MNDCRFNGISRNNLSKIKDGAYAKNIDGKQSKGTHWVLLFIDSNEAVHFDYFGSKYIPQEVLSKIIDKSITHNIFRTQSDDSIMRGCYCMAFIV